MIRLTGLANRALFLDRLRLTLARLQRRPDRHFAVMFLDLDHFKSVNDTLGHAAGDALLLEISRRLHDCVRPQDTVARFGGDEFARAARRGGRRKRCGRHCRADTGAGADGRWILKARRCMFPASIGIAMVMPEYRGARKRCVRDCGSGDVQAKAAGKARHAFAHCGPERCYDSAMPRTQAAKAKAGPKTRKKDSVTPVDHALREIVILTGMSGSGKASALKAFEDLGYYSVDNLPLELIPRFADLVRAVGGDFACGAGGGCSRRHAAGPVSGDSEDRCARCCRRAWCFWRRAKRRLCGGSRRRGGRIRWAAARR